LIIHGERGKAIKPGIFPDWLFNLETIYVKIYIVNQFAGSWITIGILPSAI
jgi:hypothetical protein